MSTNTAPVPAFTSAADVAHFINGRSLAGTSGRRQAVYNPTTGAVARQVTLASADEVTAAVAAAQALCDEVAALGQPRPQNAQGHLLGHVRDVGLRVDDPNVRIYQTHERQTFHTDSCDIVGLLCLQTARAGGLSALVSSVTVYNRLRAQRPDLCRLLFQPMATDRRGEVPPGCKPYFEIPPFNWYQGAFAAIYQRQYLNSAQRFADAPRLSPAQVEALDALDALAEDPALHLMMALEPGDLQFVHNHRLLHDRTAFDDWPEPARRRYLLRLWLAPVDAQPLPPVYAQRYGNVVPGQRGGVSLPGVSGVMPLPED